MRTLRLAPDTILYNGVLHTMDAEHPRAEAIAIKDDRIVAVGSSREVLRLADGETAKHDLGGKHVTPGIIDAHNHLFRTGRTLKSVSVHGTRSIAEIQEKLAAAIPRIEPGTWLYGSGWNEQLLKEQRFPTRDDLDAVTTDVPVVLGRTWNKLVANSLALELAGVDESVSWPPADLRYAGEVLRFPDGRLTGVLTDRAKHLVLDKIPYSDEYIMSCIAEVCQEYNRVGITSVVDPGLRPEELRGYVNALKGGYLSVRSSVCVGMWGHTSVQIAEEEALHAKLHNMGVFTGFGNDLLRLDCAKIMPDGGGSDGTALMYEPFHYRPDFRGEATVDPEAIEGYVRFAHDRGWSVDAHCCGDRMQDIVAEAMAKAIRENPDVKVRHRIHHGYLPTERALDLMAEYQIAAVTQPVFLYSQGESMVHHMGEQVSHRLMPARTYMNRGIPLAFSSDTGVAPYDPWIGIYSAVTRRSIDGHEFDQTETVDRYEALRAYTIDAAWMTFEEDRKGSLEPGKLADLVVLNDDFDAARDDDIKNFTVASTMLGGNWVHQAESPAGAQSA